MTRHRFHGEHAGDPAAQGKHDDRCDRGAAGDHHRHERRCAPALQPCQQRRWDAQQDGGKDHDRGEQPGRARLGAEQADARQEQGSSESSDGLQPPDPADEPYSDAGPALAGRRADEARQSERQPGGEQRQDRDLHEGDEALPAEPVRAEEARRRDRDRQQRKLGDECSEDVPAATS
jgi:hypothetical protein